MRRWPSPIRYWAAICAAERLHGVTLEWRMVGSSPLTSTIGLEKPAVRVSTSSSSSVRKRQPATLSSRSASSSSATSSREVATGRVINFDAEHARPLVEPVEDVEGELVARAVDQRHAARGEDDLAAGDRGRNGVVERTGRLDDLGAKFGAHAAGAAQRARGGADRNAAALGDFLEPDAAVGTPAFALSRHVRCLENGPLFLQRIFRLRKKIELCDSHHAGG